MNKPVDSVIRDARGREVKVTRIPMSTGRDKFKSTKPKFDSSMSPFEQFKDSSGSRVKSF